MDEWTALKELEDLAELERREARSFSWDNARHWVLANAWGLLGRIRAWWIRGIRDARRRAGLRYARDPHVRRWHFSWCCRWSRAPCFCCGSDSSSCSRTLAGTTDAGGRVSRDSVAFAAFVAHAGSPDAVRARRVHAGTKARIRNRRIATQAFPRCLRMRRCAKARPVTERRGGRRVDAPTLPEIAIERPPGGVRFTNNSAQTLTITAVLQPELGQVKTWTGRPIAECAQLAGPRGELPAPPTVLRPGEQVTFAGKPDCGGLETAPRADNGRGRGSQPVVYTLKVLR